MFLLPLLLTFAAPSVKAEAGRVVIAGIETKTGTVAVVQDKRSDETPMLGVWTTEDKSLTFTPRFAFEAGVTYRIVIADQLDTTFTLPASTAAPGKVDIIHPQADKLPANLLRFYIHFDSEMKQGQAAKHLSLLNADGKAVAYPFLQLDEELWSDDGKRFTLLLDPGRVKKELRPRQELGPVLEEGKKYTLVIGRDFQTQTGKPLAAEVRKTFTVTAPFDNALDPSKWKVFVPKVGTRDVVEIKFNVLLDHALLARVLTIETAAGESVAGTVTFDTDDTHWRWTPKTVWPAGDYRIVIQNVLEDVCGNRIGAAFDAVIGEVGARRLKEPTKLSFVVK
ncbi:hypothetical protein BH11PLA2_BH11PLA2_12840 [soil metagenome]